jgi:hypothetical protein
MPVGPIFASLFALAATAPAVPAEAPAARPRFESLFTDWSGANRDSIAAEQLGLRRPQVEVAAGPGAVPGSPALGERVGEIVALGDCSEGERVARAAGDFALVAAVRGYCSAADAPR